MDIYNCCDSRQLNQSPNRSKLKSSLFSLSFLCSWIVLYSPCVYPAVTPDGVTATTVTTTINGVPIVGIVAPTPGGVSHNTFETFNVGLEGVIINNSLVNGTSALPGVGALPNNTNFGIGPSATIILNEVTSNINRSNLLGTTEIFGDNASYILANPNGITCNGCGFIRTPTAVGDTGNLREVILSTSDAFTLFGNDLNDLSIVTNSTADIVIGPGGLNVSNVDVTTLFTRTLNIDGLISAANNRLQMLLGTGSLAFDAVLPEDRTFTSTQSNDGAVTVAIDASVAGAMNAGQIYIMATEDGVGVTLDNDLIASAGDVVLTANGDIVYRNVNASDSFNVTTNGIGSTLTVNGTTVASNDINWNLSGDVAINTGAATSIDVGNDFTVNCTSGNCDINSQDSLTLNATQINSNAGIITTAGSNLVVNANLNTSGDLQSGNDLTINAPGQIIANNLFSAGDLQLTANTISSNNANAGSELVITSTGSTNTNNLTATDSLTVNSASLNANNIQTDNELTISTTGNATTATITAVSSVNINGDTIITGDIQTDDALVISAVGNASTGNVDAASAVNINSSTLLTGDVLTGDALTITTTGNTTTDNIDATGATSLSAASLSTGDIQTANALTITTTGNTTIDNINAALDIDINAATLNADDIQSGDVINITTIGNTTTADMTAVSDINVAASNINATNINSGNNVTLTASSGNISALILSAINDINVTTQAANADLFTTAINSGNDVNWQLNGVAQLTGDIAATNNINFNCITPGCVVNANSALQLNAQDLNTQAAIQTANNQNLTINANVQSSADISSGNRLQINATNGDINTSGSLSANQNIELSSATDGDINIAGTITTGNDFIIAGDGNYNHNNNGSLNIAGEWIIDTHSLTNNDTLIATDLQNNVFRVDEFHNNGLFQSDGPLTVQVDDLLNNNGVIASLEGVIKINHSQNEGNAGTINNNGIISAINLSEQQQPENTLIINPQSLIDDYIADILSGKQRTSQDLVNDINAANLETLSQLTAGTGELGSMQINANVLNNFESAIINATQITLDVDSLSNQGGLISATENIAINGDTLSNSNADSLFGVITTRDNIDITLNDQFDNEGVIEAIDIVIDAPIQNNSSSDLVVSGLAGENVSTASSLDATAAQQWFGVVSGSETYYQYNEAGDSLSLIDSNLSQLTDVFLATSGANTGGLPVVGDDLFLAQLITDTLRENGDIPFVTNDRNNLAQLSTLYNNTLDYINETNLNFGQLPSATQRQTMDVPIIVFQQQTLSNGDPVFVPTVLLPNSELNTNVLAADQLNSRIIAHNELLLKSEQITNSGDLIAGNNLIIDTIDLTLTTTARNWFVNDEGEVKYHSAMISSPSLAITVSGNYVQKGGQLITDTPIIIEAENIDIAGIDIQAQNSLRTAEAKLESTDVLYLLAKQRLNVGSNAHLTSQVDTVLSAGQALSVNGNLQSGKDLTLIGQRIRVGEAQGVASQNTAASLLAQGNILMQSESFIELGYADITASQAQNNNINDAEEENTEVLSGGIVLLAQDGYIHTQNTTLNADNDLYLSASDNINSRSSHFNAIDITAQAASQSLSNTTLNSTGSTALLAERSVDINNSTLNSQNNIDLMAETGNIHFNNSEGQAQGDITAIAEQGKISHNRSTLSAQGNIAEQAGSIKLKQSTINSTSSTMLLADKNIQLDSSELSSQGDIDVYSQAGDISLKHSQLNSQGSATLIADAGKINNNQSQLVAQGDITQQAKNITLNKTTTDSAGTTSLIADGNLKVENSTLSSQSGIDLYSQTGDIQLNKSKLNSQGDTNVVAVDGAIFNALSNLLSLGDITQQANDITVTNSTFENNGSDADLGATSLLAKNNLTSNKANFKTGNLNLFAEEGNVTINSSNLNAKGDMTLKAGNSVLLNSSWVNAAVNGAKDDIINGANPEPISEDNPLYISGNLNIIADNGDIINDRGSLSSENNSYMKAANNIENLGGQLQMGNNLHQEAGGDIKNTTLINQDTQSTTQTIRLSKDDAMRRSFTQRVKPKHQQAVNATQTTTIDGLSVVLASTQAEGNITQIAGGDIINDAGKIKAGGTLYQQAEGNIKNLSQDIQLRKTTITQYQKPGSQQKTTQAKSNIEKNVLLLADSSAGKHLVVKAKGTYENTGNISATTGDIDISAKDIINTRLTHKLDNQYRSDSFKQKVKKRSTKTKQTTTRTTGRQQVLDTGRMAAGGNISLNAENKITDTAGRYTAGTGGFLKNAEGELIRDSQGNAVKGGVYASAKNGIEMNAIEWTENTTTTKTKTKIKFDKKGNIKKIKSKSKLRSSESTDHIVTGNINSAGSTSLKSESGDINLAGSDIQSGDVIQLKGKNITLSALSKTHDVIKKKKRKKTQDTTIGHDVVNLNAQNGIILTTTGDKDTDQGNLTTQGTKLNAGSGEKGNVIMNVTGDTNLDAVNDEVYSYYYKKKKRSWGRSKTTIIESRDVTLNETEIKGGGNLLVNVEIDDLGQPIGKDSGTVTLNGTNINMGQNTIIYGEEGVNVLSGIEYDFKRKEVHKSGFGGFSKSGKTHIEDVQRLGHAEITTGGDTVLLSKNNVNVVAGKLTANNITADAGFGLTDAERAAAKSEGKANVNIIGDKEVLASFDHKYKRNIKLSLKDDFLSIAEDVHKKDWETEENVIGSVLNARKDINLRAANDINIVGSELSAANNIKLNADNNVNILAALNSAKNKTEISRERIGIEVKVDSNGIKAFAGREQQTITDKRDISGVKASLLQAGNNVSIKAGGDINQRGSDVIALNDISYNADGAILLDTATSIETVEHAEFLRRDGISTGLQHNFDATKDAVKNMGKGGNGVSKVSSTLQAIDSVDNFASGPTANAFAGTTTTRSSETHTSELARGSVTQAGGNVSMNAGTDIDVVGSVIVAVLDIDLTADNVTITAVENQFSQSSSFRSDQSGVVMSGQKNSASIGLSDSYSKQRSKQQSTSSQSSLLSAGNNTNITARNDIKITGSDVNADNDISIDAGRDVLIQAHRSDTTTASKGSSGGAETGLSATVGPSGAALGVYGSANAAKNHLNRDGVSYRNSQLTAGNTLNITSGRDTTLRGANAEAEQVELTVGGDFTLASIQDTGHVDGKQKDANARVVAGAGFSGSGSVGVGKTSGSKAWVTQQTTLIARDKLDVNVNGHTQIDGAVLASKTDNLNLDTNTLAYSDIKDHDKETSSYLNVGISGSSEKGSNPAQQQNNIQTGLPTASGQQKGGGGGYGATVSGNYSNTDREQINRATIGNGNITVRNDAVTGNNSIASINRDVTKAQEIIKDESSNTQIYASDSSINAISNPGETLEKWGANLAQYDTSTFEAIDGLVRSTEYGIDVGNAIGSLFSGESLSTAIAEGRGAIANRVAAWQVTKYEQQAALTLKNAETKTPEEVQAATQILASTIAELSGTDKEIIVKAMLEDAQTPAFKGATDGENIFVDFREGKGTSVSDSGDIANVVGHEVSHVVGVNENSAEYLGSVAESAWQNELGRSGLGRDTGNASQDAAWVTSNKDNSLLQTNTKEFLNTTPGQLEFYNEAGHYYTSYYVGLKLGLSDEDSRTLALYSQLPDEIGRLDAINVEINYLKKKILQGATFLLTGSPNLLNDVVSNAEKERDSVQIGGHALTGYKPEDIRKVIKSLIREAETVEEVGLLVHALADTYAHTEIGGDNLYDTGLGHLFDSTSPDEIHRRPGKYLEYLDDLIVTLPTFSGFHVKSSDLNIVRVETKTELLAAVKSAETKGLVKSPNPRGKDSYNHEKISEETIKNFSQLVNNYKEGLKVDKPELHDIGMGSYRNVREDVENYVKLSMPATNIKNNMDDIVNSITDKILISREKIYTTIHSDLHQPPNEK